MTSTKQYNLKLPQNLAKTAEEFAERYGYRNVQDLAIDSLREKLYEQNRYDETFSGQEIDLIDELILESIKNDELVDEEELMNLLRA